MDYTVKKQQLVDEYNKNQAQIQQLTSRQQQIIGQIQLIEETEKEVEKEPTKKK